MMMAKRNLSKPDAPHADALPTSTDAPSAQEVAAVWVPRSALHAWAENPRKNDGEPVQKVMESIRRFGFAAPIVARTNGEVIAGHTRLKAAEALGLDRVPVRYMDLDPAEAHLLALADNKLNEEAEWDASMVASILSDFSFEDAALAGWDSDDLDKLADELGANAPREVEEDEVPEVPVVPVTKPGDLWLLGEHRVLCGDSTKAEDVARLMGVEKAQLVHADPPYGMGKEKDGVQNDNLYADKLDAFQMAWWKAFRLHTDDNASAYIWGNAEELWRLWYVGGLKDSERLTMRNEIVWGKGFGQGMESEQHRMFPTATERCLFFMLGEQGFNNNADNYWEGWEPIRGYLEAEMNKCGGAKNWKAALGNQMGGHYFTKSQWCFPTEEAYKKLQSFGKGDAFKREHDAFKREYDELKREFYKTRAHFDNTHDKMTDVWEFPRVTGEDRHGHATPKPVAMICRAIKSSSETGAVVAEPFLGSGTTLIAAEQTQRKCYGMEIDPHYCDVIVKRWETLTGKKAELAVS